ncbi:MAG: V-type ATPase subunit [Clostridiaceae bacterium]
MGNVIRYGAVNTKIKSMRSSFLTKEQFQKLINTNSFEEAIRFLKEETDYKELFQGISADSIHRGQFEIILKRYHIDRLYKLTHYFSGEYKKLIKIFFMRYEIEDLKVILRSKYVNRSRAEIEDMLAYKNPLNTIDYDYLLSSSDMHQLIGRLEDSIYYKQIKPFEHTINKEGLFMIENNLDILFHSTLRKFIKHLDPEDREVISDIIGFEADMLNISAIYRGRKYYNLSPEVIYNYTIYDYYKLKPEIMKKLCYAKDMNEYFEILKDLPYKQIIPMNDNEDFLIEVYERASFKKFLDKYMAKFQLNISVLMAFFYLLNIEIKNIVSIVENKRYGAEDTDLIEYLNTSLKKG